MQFVSEIVCEGLSGGFFERWKGVCVGEGERERESSRESTQNSTALSCVKLSLFLSSMKYVTGNTSLVLHRDGDR